MTADLFLPLLSIGTLAALAIFALVGQNKTRDRKNDPSTDKSTLARDKNSHGEPADV